MKRMRLTLFIGAFAALICISGFCGNRRQDRPVFAAISQNTDSLKDRALRLRLECEAGARSLEAATMRRDAAKAAKIVPVSASEAVHYRLERPPE